MEGLKERLEPKGCNYTRVVDGIEICRHPNPDHLCGNRLVENGYALCTQYAGGREGYGEYRRETQ